MVLRAWGFRVWGLGISAEAQEISGIKGIQSLVMFVSSFWP